MSKDKIFLFLILIALIAGFYFSGLPRYFFEKRGEFLIIGSGKDNINNDEIKAKPEPVYSKGVYITFGTAGSSRMDNIIDLIKRTELNTVIIDVKDYTGRIGFITESDLIHKIGSEKKYIPDMKGLIDKLHNEGIYTIARIAVFQDNYYPRIRQDLALKRAGGGLWLDNKGLSWFDPSSQEVWDYTIEIAKQAIKAGFDEVNFDYIRFPSDGIMANIVYPFWDGKTLKKDVMKSFFEYLSQRLRPLNVYLSADLFGLTLTTTNDMNIGQWLEYAAPYFDYICPMVYPSHYPTGFLKFENPALHPYEIIYNGLSTGEERLATMSEPGIAKIRPWLQDFDMGAIYDAQMIELQKQAVYDAGAYGWLLWNPKNDYTDKGLLKEQ